MIFAFDLDGTVTREETLPLLARELGLYEELMLLTKLTLKGSIGFEQSFRLRYQLLKDIPLARIRAIMAEVRLDEEIVSFIRSRAGDCALVTGNLDVWIEPLSARLGCRVFASRSCRAPSGELLLAEVLDKGAAIRQLKQRDKVAAIGESFNDIPMFEAADYAVAYAGVHMPVDAAIAAADWVAFDGASLCRLLERCHEWPCK